MTILSSKSSSGIFVSEVITLELNYLELSKFPEIRAEAREQPYKYFYTAVKKSFSNHQKIPSLNDLIYHG